MTIVFYILISFLSLLGLACLIYSIKIFVWPRIAFRFKSKSYRKAKEKRLTEQRFIAKSKGLKKFPFKKSENVTITIWAKSERSAKNKYQRVKKQYKTSKELFLMP